MSAENQNTQNDKQVKPQQNFPPQQSYQPPYGNNQWSNQFPPYYYNNYYNMPYNQNMNYLGNQFNQMSMYTPNYYGGYPMEGQFGAEQFKYGQNIENFSFTKNFPKAKDYNNMDSIVEAFSHLKNVNSNSFDPDTITHSDFFILRSTNDDDIHKAIKYQYWTSSAKNNENLSRIWRENNAKAVPVPIFLFFSVVKSQQFLGVAKMVSDFDPKRSFKYWWEECKWFGTFGIEWIYIKDIHEKQFEHIRDNGTPITAFTDGLKISDKSGKQMLNIFKNSPNKPNIFAAFDYMDKREEYLRRRDDDPNFTQKFKSLSEQFALNPSSIRNKPYNKFYKKPFTKNEKHLADGEGYKKPFVPTHTNQELHEMFNITTAKQKKEKRKTKKKKPYRNEETIEYNVKEGVKGEINESSSEDEEPKKEEVANEENKEKLEK